jgi:hypothetical protein
MGVEMNLNDKIANNVWDHVADVMPTLKAASKGEWTWFNNWPCKYIELRIDMRDGGCLIRDREGNRIDPETLRHQAFQGGGEPWPARKTPEPQRCPSTGELFGE